MQQQVMAQFRLKPVELVTLRHHTTEIYARRISRAIVKGLCTALGSYGAERAIKTLAADSAWVQGQAKIYGVSADHRELVARLVDARIRQLLGD